MASFFESSNDSVDYIMPLITQPFDFRKQRHVHHFHSIFMLPLGVSTIECSQNVFSYSSTLEYRIIVPPLLIFEIFSKPPALIPTPHLLLFQNFEDVNV